MQQQILVILGFCVLLAFSQSKSTFATYSTDVQVVGIINGNEYFAFEGTAIVDNPNDRYATKGIQSSDFTTYNATTVTTCGSNSTYWVDYSNGTCDVGCCHGYDYNDVAIPKSPLEIIMNPFSERNYYGGCSCGYFHIFLYLVAASPVGSCHRADFSGTLHRYQQDTSDFRAVIDYCMSSENTPIFYHESVVNKDGTDYETVVDMTFINFTNQINTSIFQIPDNCNCPYYN